MCGGPSSTWRGFIPSTSPFTHQLHSTNASHSPSSTCYDQKDKGRSLGTHQKVMLSRNRGVLNTKIISLRHYVSGITLPERQNGTACFPGSDDDKNTVPLTASPRFLSRSFSLSLSLSVCEELNKCQNGRVT
jgi:hypothetical protein